MIRMCVTTIALSNSFNAANRALRASISETSKLVSVAAVSVLGKNVSKCKFAVVSDWQ
jgi:hypothetical protein